MPEKENIQGEWIKYEQGSDAKPLYESLQGHGTGWCTAGESTAETQLKAGDFYVFYTKDKQIISCGFLLTNKIGNFLSKISLCAILPAVSSFSLNLISDAS